MIMLLGFFFNLISIIMVKYVNAQSTCVEGLSLAAPLH